MDWKKIMLHCSDTEDSGTVSWGAIRRYHREVKGWHDIGYHAGVELVGTNYEALIGRSLKEPGAHCPEAGMNHLAIGVCLVGQFEKTPPPPEQIECARDRVILPFFEAFGIGPKDIVFHNEYAPWRRTCPGKALTRAYLNQFIPGVL